MSILTEKSFVNRKKRKKAYVANCVCLACNSGSMSSRTATGQSGYIMLEKSSHYESNTPAFRASYAHMFLDFVRKKQHYYYLVRYACLYYGRGQDHKAAIKNASLCWNVFLLLFFLCLMNN